MEFQCSGATVTLPVESPRDRCNIRGSYRAYRRLLDLSPQAARRRLVFAYDGPPA